MAMHSLGVRGLCMLGEVDSRRFVFGADPKAHDAVDQLGTTKDTVNAYIATATAASDCLPSCVSPPP